MQRRLHQLLAGKKRQIAYDFEFTIHSMINYPQGGNIYAKWKLAGQQGVTEEVAVDSQLHSVTWDYTTRCPAAFNVETKSNAIRPLILHISVREAVPRRKPKKIGIVDMNLAEFLSNDEKSRAIPLMKTDFNISLKVTVVSRQKSGDPLFLRPRNSSADPKDSRTPTPIKDSQLGLALSRISSDILDSQGLMSRRHDASNITTPVSSGNTSDVPDSQSSRERLRSRNQSGLTQRSWDNLIRRPSLSIRSPPQFRRNNSDSLYHQWINTSPVYTPPSKPTKTSFDKHQRSLSAASPPISPTVLFKNKDRRKTNDMRFELVGIGQRSSSASQFNTADSQSSIIDFETDERRCNANGSDATSETIPLRINPKSTQTLFEKRKRSLTAASQSPTITLNNAERRTTTEIQFELEDIGQRSSSVSRFNPAETQNSIINSETNKERCNANDGSDTTSETTHLKIDALADILAKNLPCSA